MEAFVHSNPTVVGWLVALKVYLANGNNGRRQGARVHWDFKK